MAGMKRKSSTTADDSSRWFQPARYVPKWSRPSVSYFTIGQPCVRLLFRINSRREQESSNKVVHKFTEFTRPAPDRHWRDTWLAPNELKAHPFPRKTTKWP
jgi:hypothetical protein